MVMVDRRYEEARRRAGRLRGFYIHAVAFAFGNVGLFVINWMTLGDGKDAWWFQWALMGWGIALGVHAITVMSRGGWLGRDWEDRHIAKYLEETCRAADREPEGAGRM